MGTVLLSNGMVGYNDYADLRASGTSGPRCPICNCMKSNNPDVRNEVLYGCDGDCPCHDEEAHHRDSSGEDQGPGVSRTSQGKGTSNQVTQRNGNAQKLQELPGMQESPSSKMTMNEVIGEAQDELFRREFIYEDLELITQGHTADGVLCSLGVTLIMERGKAEIVGYGETPADALGSFRDALNAAT